MISNFMFQIVDQFLKCGDEIHFYAIYEALKLFHTQNVALTTPKQRDFLKLSQQLFLRDSKEGSEGIFDFTAARMLNILAFYNSLTREIVDKVFNVEYLDVFEQSLTRIKSEHRTNMRRELMMLNRTVTILHPEFGVSPEMCF